jgi:hypothetical protein
MDKIMVLIIFSSPLLTEDTDDMKCVLHGIKFCLLPQALTTRSISTQAPSGSAAAPIAVRAGKGGLKYYA